MSTADRVVIHGAFFADGQDFVVDNYIWMIGDGEEVIVVDAADDQHWERGPVSGRVDRARLPILMP